MSVAHPFAGFNPKPTIWGYNWTAPEAPPPKASPLPPPPPAQSPPMMVDQYANLPAALISTLKREKKPFTYTPGGVNLSEVLNQRLQKRMERKKKYSEERASTPKQLIVAPTYNTPLDMYSNENALEAMVTQAELVAADNSLSSPSRSATLPRNHTFRFEGNEADKGVTQSKAFRVLQIITDTEDASTDRPHPQHIDEMRFKGLRENKADIPSRFFHHLQRITGTEEQEEADAPVQPSRREPRPHPSSSAPPNVPPTRGPSSAPTPGGLKRPAAFLPIKTSPGFRPVSFLSNGPVQRNSTGTDF